MNYNKKLQQLETLSRISSKKAFQSILSVKRYGNAGGMEGRFSSSERFAKTFWSFPQEDKENGRSLSHFPVNFLAHEHGRCKSLAIEILGPQISRDLICC